MADAHMKARMVRVRREEGETGLFYATSPDMKGLLVAEPSLDALEQAIPKAIADLYAACGTKVVVTRVEDESEDHRLWVAIPAEIARRSLEEKTQSA